MKYFLAIDKGQIFKNSLRCSRINLETIDDKLASNNNLQALCTFTTAFENEAQLKTFLQAKGLLELKDVGNGLIITYYREYNRYIKIPYAKNSKFLNFKNLEEIIYRIAKKPGFLQVIISHYSNYQNLFSEMYSFRGYLSNPYADYKFYDVVRRFVDKVCFREVNGKKKINYKGLYDLGMLISNLEEYEKAEKIKVEKKADLKSSFRERINEDDPEYFHLEELESRKNEELDGQMRLF